MLFKQLHDQQSCTYTYLIADTSTGEAVFIDPVDTQIDRYLALLTQQQLELKYSLETHVHADHITASGQLRQLLGVQTGVAAACGAPSADMQIADGDIFTFGADKIMAIATAGHTPGSMSFLWQDRLFTGDSLLIDGCGRCDFQGGDAGAMFDSVMKLFALPDETLVYPGHDYNGRWVSSIMQEKTSNSRLAATTRAQFIATMDNLKLPAPKMIDSAVAANRYCGVGNQDLPQSAGSGNA